MKGQKQKENELRIETEIARNLAKYWYEKAKEKVKLLISAYEDGDRNVYKAVPIEDLASILDQQPEPEKQPEVNDILDAFRETAWIALCYNDHNFNETDLIAKAKEICRMLNVKSIDDANNIISIQQPDITAAEEGQILLAEFIEFIGAHYLHDENITYGRIEELSEIFIKEQEKK